MRALVVFAIVGAFCNHTYATNCGGNKSKYAMAKTTVASPEENDYDVERVDLKLTLQNTNTQVQGMVTTYATSLISSFSTYAFELNQVLVIDSVVLNGQNLPVTTTGSLRKVTLPVALAIYSRFKAEVYYSGQPASGSGQFFTGGLNHVQVPSGSHIMYSLSDPDFTDDWWPCKQSLLDKIDTVRMDITVADSLTAASNGILLSRTALPGNLVTYTWQTNYPIDYYLVCVAVAPYKEYSYHMHFTDGSNDSMLVQNFVYDSTSFMTPARKMMLDSVGMMIDHFSAIFGKYPFHKEKYGHCMTVLGGGMEHQTMTFMSTPNMRTTLLAHELGHQWWGNNVTYGKWDDIWLSEGMATYCEQLFLEYFQGNAAAKATRTSVFNNVMNLPNGSVWVNDTTDVNRVFDGRLTYNKGAAVAHMLRYLAPQDSLFFKGLRIFQQQYMYSNALTADFEQVMEQAYGSALDSFFRQWVYGEGYPVYSVKWEQAGTQVHLKVTQAPTHASVKAFQLPLEIKLNSASGDTIVRMNITDTTVHDIFYWDKTMVGLSVDPNDHIVNRTGQIARDPNLLNIAADLQDKVVIYPNPATIHWTVDNIPPGTGLRLLDIQGRVLWSAMAGGQVLIPAATLPNGAYILELGMEAAARKHYRLTK